MLLVAVSDLLEDPLGPCGFHTRSKGEVLGGPAFCCPSMTPGQTVDMLEELNFPSNSALVFSQRSRSSWGQAGLGFLLRSMPSPPPRKHRLLEPTTLLNCCKLRNKSRRVSARLAEDERCLFEPFLKRTHREAELFARDFTGSEIFTQTFLLRQH